MPKSPTDLRKAAILIVTLPDHFASRLLERLDRVTAKKLSAEIRELGEIRQDERSQALADFMEQAFKGDLRRASAILERWVEPQTDSQYPRFTL